MASIPALKGPGCFMSALRTIRTCRPSETEWSGFCVWFLCGFFVQCLTGRPSSLRHPRWKLPQKKSQQRKQSV